MYAYDKALNTKQLTFNTTYICSTRDSNSMLAIRNIFKAKLRKCFISMKSTEFLQNSMQAVQS